MPRELRQHLDTWGPQLQQTIAAAQMSWARAKRVQGFRRLGAAALRIGTDCSGAEAPVWALREMRVPHRQIFSCDVDPTVRSFIQAASPPETAVYEDMLRRSVDELADVDIYVVGFPCTPYSMLRRHSTRLLREAAAKPYFELLRVLRAKRPALAILENVLGLRSVLPRILRDLKKLRWYNIVHFVLDPPQLGEPVSRPRFYILLLRHDAVVLQNMADITDFVTSCLRAARKPVKQHVRSRMLPKTHEQVREFLRNAATARGQARRGGSKQGVPVFRGGSSSMPLSSARQAEAWASALRIRGVADVIADVSQSSDRINPRTDGVCPTLTPNGICCVGLCQRPILGCEKLLLHGFPLHRMKIPASISQRALGLLGGNTMHLQCIGLVLLIGIALLKETLPPRPVSDASGKIPQVVHIKTVAATSCADE